MKKHVSKSNGVLDETPYNKPSTRLQHTVSKALTSD